MIEKNTRGLLAQDKMHSKVKNKKDPVDYSFSSSKQNCDVLCSDRSTLDNKLDRLVRSYKIQPKLITDLNKNIRSLKLEEEMEADLCLEKKDNLSPSIISQYGRSRRKSSGIDKYFKEDYSQNSGVFPSSMNNSSIENEPSTSEMIFKKNHEFFERFYNNGSNLLQQNDLEKIFSSPPIEDRDCKILKVTLRISTERKNN